MGLGRHNLRRSRRRASQDIDLLGAAFGLGPSLLRGAGHEKKEKKKKKILPRELPSSQSESEDDCQEPESESESETSSEKEVQVQPPSPRRKRSSSSSKSRPRYRVVQAPSVSTSKQSSRASTRRVSPRATSRRSLSIATSRRPSSRSTSASGRTVASVQPEQRERNKKNKKKTKNQHAASFVRPSATFPPAYPLALSKHCTIPSSSSIPASPFNASFGSIPFQHRQQLYYQTQPQVAISQVPAQPQVPYQIPNFQQPHQPAVQTPTYVAPPIIQHISTKPPPAVTSSNALALSQPMDESKDSTLSGWADGPGPLQKELRRLQRHIDRKMADLAQEPRSKILRRDLSILQERLRWTLNQAIANKEGDRTDKPYSSRRNDQDEATDHQAKPRRDASSPSHYRLSANEVKQDPSSLKKAPKQRLPGQRERSIERHPRFHLCSKCGIVRSQRFHERHPLTPEKKPTPNLCESCREEAIARGVVEEYHFCFNCGKARSRSYQRDHRVLPGDSIVPNYCAVCLDEAQDNEDIAESSVVCSVSKI